MPSISHPLFSFSVISVIWLSYHTIYTIKSLDGTLPSGALPKAQNPGNPVTAVVISSTIAGSLIPILTIVPNDPIKNSDNGAAAQAVVISSTNAAGSVVAVSTLVPPNVVGNSENGLQNAAPSASVATP